MPVLGFFTSKPSILPDECLQARTGDSFWDVREELQAELTQEVVFLLKGQEHKVWTHTVERQIQQESHFTKLLYQLLEKTFVSVR